MRVLLEWYVISNKPNTSTTEIESCDTVLLIIYISFIRGEYWES